MNISNDCSKHAAPVESQLPSQKKPPEPSKSTTLARVMIVAIAVLGITFLTAGLVSCIPPFVVIGAVLVIAATIATVAALIFHKFSQKTAKVKTATSQKTQDAPPEPLDFFAKAESAISNKTAVAKIKKLLSRKSNLSDHYAINMKHARHNHLLHDHITGITKSEIVNSTDDKLKSQWKQFLESLHNLKAFYPDGGSVELDFLPEIASMDPSCPKKVLEIEEYDSDKLTQDDLMQIYEIDKESFDSDPKHGPGWWKWNMARTNSRAIIARDKDLKIIEGVFSYCLEKPKVLLITTLARRANAAKIGVANKMFDHFFEKDVKAQKPKLIKLQVRKSNKPAQELYTGKGFQTIATLKNYYSKPVEDAYLMHCKP